MAHSSRLYTSSSHQSSGSNYFPDDPPVFASGVFTKLPAQEFAPRVASDYSDPQVLHADLDVSNMINDSFDEDHIVIAHLVHFPQAVFATSSRGTSN